MSATIKDVAKLAGVSISTVSLALNRPNEVREETRQRVLEAVEKLNYHPNKMAQGLIRKRTGNISVTISGPQYEQFSSPLLFEIVKGISEVIRASEYDLMLHMTTAEEEVRFVREQIRSRSCDGMILWGSRMGEESLLDIFRHALPVVTIGRYLNHPGTYSVTSNDLHGGYYATKHLLELGHRKIAFIGALQGISSARERCDGYKNALVEYGVPVDANLVLSADYYQESGYAAMRRLLELDKKGVTAVFAASDLMALGAMKAVLDAGLRVPHDISVVGFDNIPNSDLFVVPLTTVAMPAREMGEIAAAKMIHLLERQAVEEKTELDVELVVRNSTAPPIGALGREG
ncbi:MAG: hypothetical protein AA931_05010 [Peptococcaceae bacterium 1109]|nr:MAG: hypothetical protein AA931_05010 [Peptococcaceae bacterium 1109]